MNTSGILVEESLDIYAGRRGDSCNEDLHVVYDILLTASVKQKLSYIICFFFIWTTSCCISQIIKRTRIQSTTCARLFSRYFGNL
jgi:hypothetical protein